ncbi:sulfotransferase family 2 domain-containing protein [Tritonibacter mobilis]|uniref:sulfotransferase family 2 domain-containing protein n=1 Tax=Tritonibacter mobilis TaxID=379347 RepID=UPI000806EE3A|nr:sulfotransferase family 2 domain-containing protein [Tritonibacter mobilis]
MQSKTTADVYKKHLRRRLENNQLRPLEAADKAKFRIEDFGLATEILSAAYEKEKKGVFLERLGQIQINLGNDVLARSLMRDAFQTFGTCHITNIILSEIAATVAIVDDEKKLLYIPMPKCGSSTVKNYFTQAMFGEAYGELVHFRHPEIYRVVYPEDLKTRYADYMKFCVVRDPVSRVASYFLTNVAGGSLRREVSGENTFLGLRTNPGPLEVSKDFELFRSTFMDFRHHTDAMSSYVREMLPDMDRVYSISELHEVKELLEDKYSVSIPDQKSMVGSSDKEKTSATQKAFESTQEFYAEDYKVFGEFLK